MRVEIDRDELLRPLQSVLGVVERRQTLPVLGNLLVVASDWGITLTATDLEVELQASAGAVVAATGATTLPARKLMDIVRNLPNAARIHLSVEHERAVVRSGRSRFTLGTLPANDFPTVEDIGTTERLELPRAQLRWLLDKTHFSMAHQDVRYYLNGLLLQIEIEELSAVATDGHRLSIAGFPCRTQITEPRQAIVPRKGVLELLRLLDDSDEIVTIELGSNHIRAEIGDLRFTSKLIDGAFPDYSRVIPEVHEQPVVIDREVVRQALVRVAILSNERYRGVRFGFGPDLLRIQSNNPEQEEAEEEVTVSSPEQSEVEIGFNASYVLDALGALEYSVVELFVTDSTSSMLLRGEGDSGARYVVMPMRL